MRYRSTRIDDKGPSYYAQLDKHMNEWAAAGWELVSTNTILDRFDGHGKLVTFFVWVHL